jgi:flagellar basal-body rod modification protein FlgD
MTTTTAVSAAPSNPVTTSLNRPEQLGKDTFLKLLVAQLKYQNPLQPSDPSSFMAQTAQFSMVERLEELANSNKTLLGAEQSRAATALIGRQVTWKDGDTERSGVVASVRLGADGPTLVVGTDDVPYSAITTVSAPAAAPSPTA